MKRWGLYRIAYLCLLVTAVESMTSAARAANTNNVSSLSRARLNAEAGMLLGQAAEVLGPGSTGAAVKDLQAMLALMGYYSGAVDGAYEQMTAEAVRQFQTDVGLTADGITGPLTWRQLLPTPATLANPLDSESTNTPDGLSEGGGSTDEGNDIVAQASSDLPILQLDDVGADVSRLQSRLAALNLYTGPVDGVFGIQTEQAVQQFQSQSGLIVDGVVGPTTWLELFE